MHSVTLSFTKVTEEGTSKKLKHIEQSHC
jgi:hypothetical protein